MSRLHYEVLIYSFKVSNLEFLARIHDSIMYEFECLNIL